MLLFLLVQAIGVGFSALGIGIVACFLVPVDPARLSGLAARFQADTYPPGRPVASRLFRLVFGLLAAGWAGYIQYGFVLRDLIDPPSQIPRGIAATAFVMDEGVLIAWTLYLVVAFRRAARS
jgi:hypothetical protein